MAKTVMIIRHGEKPGKDGEHPCGVDHGGWLTAPTSGGPYGSHHFEHDPAERGIGNADGMSKQLREHFGMAAD